MTATPDTRLEALGYALDDIPGPGAIYKPVVVSDNLVFVSGAVPIAHGVLQFKGKVPTEVSLEDAQRAARLCAANNLRMVLQALGSLERVARVLRLTGYVNTAPDFTEQHLVINGASDLLRSVLGEAGVGGRTAVGMAQLPLNSAVETDLILELRP